MVMLGLRFKLNSAFGSSLVFGGLRVREGSGSVFLCYVIELGIDREIQYYTENRSTVDL